jgi:hypothetical protein
MLPCQFCGRPVDIDGPELVARTKKVFRAGTMPDVSRITFCSETCAQHHDQGDEKPEPEPEIVVEVKRRPNVPLLTVEPEPVEQAPEPEQPEQTGKKRHNWSPEARAAAADRIRERNRLKAEEKKQEAEGMPEPADVRERRLAMEEVLGEPPIADPEVRHQGRPSPQPTPPPDPEVQASEDILDEAKRARSAAADRWRQIDEAIAALEAVREAARQAEEYVAELVREDAA